ncbi:hypothetical protein ABZU76_40045 [Amycolatopsis sp. NPDC005232]|uniref:hypothetical protein n=1 Tax=Amycolatopsis sp. NPDC005232 TaxID=3157027 RepID=UPI0033B08935
MPDSDGFLALLLGAGEVDAEHAAAAALDELYAYLRELARHKRSTLGDDLASTLCKMIPDDADVSGLLALASFSFLVTPSNLSAGIALLAGTPASATVCGPTRACSTRPWKRCCAWAGSPNPACRGTRPRTSPWPTW